jgi:hypothetical protein
MWAFEGAGNAVHFQEHENGSFSIHGNLASQDFRPMAGDALGAREVNKVDSLFFDIYTPDSEERDIDGAGRGLLKAFRAKPTRSHAMINYYPKDGSSPSMIAVTVILCEPSIDHVFDVYKRLFGRADLHHRITLEFFGFLPKPHPESDLLTLAEFTDPHIMTRKAHLTDSVSFSFHSATSEPTSPYDVLAARTEEIATRTQEMCNALAAIKGDVVRLGRWISIAAAIIAVIAVLFYFRH